MENEEIKNEETNEEVTSKKKEKKWGKGKEIEALQEKVKTLEEEVLRAKADLINYRRRKDEEVSSMLKFASCDIIMQILPIIDNFERALSSENEDVKSYFEGFRLIYNSLVKLLNDEGVKEIDALGKEFDPNFHQSVATRKEEGVESSMVVEVYQKGYTYKDKVIRPSMVIISE